MKTVSNFMCYKPSDVFRLFWTKTLFFYKNLSFYMLSPCNAPAGMGLCFFCGFLVSADSWRMAGVQNRGILGGM